jgi:hypothetical protein
MLEFCLAIFLLFDIKPSKILIAAERMEQQTEKNKRAFSRPFHGPGGVDELQSKFCSQQPEAGGNGVAFAPGGGCMCK